MKGTLIRVGKGGEGGRGNEMGNAWDNFTLCCSVLPKGSFGNIVGSSEYGTFCNKCISK